VNLVDGGGVIEQADGRVAHRADERELVGDARDFRQQLGRLHSRHFAGNLFENALHVVGDIFFRIPKVEVARAALQVDQDDALGAVPAGAAGGRLRGAGPLGGLQLEHAAEGHAQESAAADAKDIAPRNTEVRIAQILAGLAGDAEHRHANSFVFRAVCMGGYG
jgi:hypothetical protein